MKRYLVALLALPLFFACNNAEKQQIKDLSSQDSTLTRRTQAQDSSIMGYIQSFNDIEQNLDSIKVKSKMLSVNNGEVANQKDQVVADIRSIGELMMRNKKEIAMMERKLKQSNGKNEELQKMIAHLTEELNEKDAQIAALQSQLSESNASLKDMIQKFNDSMEVVSKQKEQISNMTNDMNTVYYAVGTMKELKKKGVVSKEGGIAGIGSTAELKKDFNTSYFTKADMTKLSALPLFSKFEKVVTNHPGDSYSITGNNKSDSLVIKDAKAFWSQSKYLVIIVK
jgi:predicted  nucleic acid-binding Zn-ribbon protein